MITKRIWRLPEVLNQTGLSRSTIYEMISRGDFPQQVKLGPRAVGWSSEDVVHWIDSRIEYSYDAQPPTTAGALEPGKGYFLAKRER
jgi:prophage regulatory protein